MCPTLQAVVVGTPWDLCSKILNSSRSVSNSLGVLPLSINPAIVSHSAWHWDLKADGMPFAACVPTETGTCIRAPRRTPKGLTTGVDFFFCGGDFSAWATSLPPELVPVPGGASGVGLGGSARDARVSCRPKYWVSTSVSNTSSSSSSQYSTSIPSFAVDSLLLGLREPSESLLPSSFSPLVRARARGRGVGATTFLPFRLVVVVSSGGAGIRTNLASSSACNF